MFGCGEGGKMAEDRPNVTATALVCVANGVLLTVCGVYGAALHEFAPKAMHSAYAGGAGGAALIVCAAMAAAPSKKLYMVGVHVALLLQLIFIVAFTVQAYKSHGVPERQDRFPLFVFMGVGTLVALGAMLKLKPKKKKEKA